MVPSCSIGIAPTKSHTVAHDRYSSSKLPHITKDSAPPIDNTRRHMSTPGDIFFVSFFDRHFIIGGTLNSTTPAEVRLKLESNSKIITPSGGYRSPTTRTGMDTSMEATSAPHHSGERVCSPEPTVNCCCHPSSDDHVAFLRDQPTYRYWY